MTIRRATLALALLGAVAIALLLLAAGSYR